MTVIFSNMQDEDCRLLQTVWKDLDDVKLIEITPSSVDWEEKVNEAIAAEKYTILFAGHGTDAGLLFPDLYRGEYVLHEDNVKLIQARKVICIWCHASAFCTKHRLNAFATSMFLPNTFEAGEYGIAASQEEVAASNSRFYKEFNSFLKIPYVPLDKWIKYMAFHVELDNRIDRFNYEGLFYQEQISGRDYIN